MAASDVTLGALDLDAVDTFGVQWILRSVQGWGSPATTISPVQKPRQDGAWSGLAYRKPRSLVLSGVCLAPTEALASDALDRLNDAVSPAGSRLTITEAGRVRWVTARQDGEVLWTRLNTTAFSYSIQLVALDPRKFGQTLTAGPTGLPSSSGGLTAPFTAPFTVNATQTSGLLTLTNTGNATGPVLLRVDGPGSGPTITHLGTGAALTFSASAVLAAGEYWLIDMEARTVLAQGQSSRNGYITSRGWSGFDPGVNQWAFTSASTSAMTLTVTGTEAFQ